ncbi:MULTISPECIES: hypothetical protein [unclassified Clostridioides]
MSINIKEIIFMHVLMLEPKDSGKALEIIKNVHIGGVILQYLKR